MLEIGRLILRCFRDEDVDAMAKLFANPDFMRFSLGVYTERKQIAPLGYRMSRLAWWNALSSTRWQRKARHSSAPAAIDIVFRPGESPIGEADPPYDRIVGRLCQTPPRGVSQKRPYKIRWWQFMELQTQRLILRSFRDEDVDAMAKLFANPDFMRFSLDVYTERKQTVAFIEKVMAWNRASMPSQFAVVPRGENRVIGYCGFHHHPEVPGEVEIGYRLHPAYWNRGLNH